MSELEASPQAAPVYARFSRRLRAVLLDALLFVAAFYVGALLIASASPSDSVRRALWFTLVFAILLYEPVLVAVWGGTIGHRLTNLRVVDDRDDRNISFIKAVVRALIKAVLGWLSFLTMTVARRHQALHDVLTRSTVQIRDKSKARPFHYASERKIEPVAGLPSRARRVTVVIAYIVLAYFGLSVASLPFLSDACVFTRHCSALEVTMSYVVGGIWFALTAFFIIFGWKGRLWGCRAHASGN
jgi:uncharacterized RDD family membrane protein YckC